MSGEEGNGPDWPRRRAALVEFALSRFLVEAESRAVDASRKPTLAGPRYPEGAAEAFWRDAADARKALAELRRDREEVCAGKKEAIVDLPPGALLVPFVRCPHDGSLVNGLGQRLAYGGLPHAWRVKPEDFPYQIAVLWRSP